MSNCYGMGAEGFQFYCFAQYGLKLTLAEAAAVRDAFFELYPGLLGYYAQQKKLVRAQGFVTNVFGRVRHLPGIRSSDQAVRAKAERQAINSPIQGGIGEMMAWSLALLDQMYGEEVQAFCEIHDAGYFYVDEDRAEEWAGKITEVMGNLPFHEFGWAPSIPFPADAEWGPDLAHMKKL